MSRAPDAAGLERALREGGLECAVEAHERLAVIVPRGTPDLTDGGRRRAAHELAMHYGFSHVAVELLERAGSGDTGAGGGAAVRRN